MNIKDKIKNSVPRPLIPSVANYYCKRCKKNQMVDLSDVYGKKDFEKIDLLCVSCHEVIFTMNRRNGIWMFN